MRPGLDCLAPLFVPGHRPERFAKAAASGADAVIIDLEDAVPADAKEAARANLRTDLTCPVIVRINGAGTAWHEADLAAVSALPLAAIMAPKSEAGVGFDGLLKRRGSIPILALVETARGLADARRIASAPGVARLAFGSVDYCADLGCQHTREALLSARCELVLASRLAGQPAPLDGVTTALDDEAQLAGDTRHARELGFGGKLCIHPRQVGPVLGAFRPGHDEIAWARQALASGDGVATLDGAMVDEAVRIRARAVLARGSSRD